MNMDVCGMSIEVRRKEIKHMYVYVKPPYGQVTVSAPLAISDATIERFVREKAEWIEKKRLALAHQAPEAEPQYVSGEPLYVWGEKYCLQIGYGKKNALLLSGDKAILTVRKESTAAQRKRCVYAWYREQLKGEIAQLLPKWEAVTGLKADHWQTKHMTTRWGSCNVKTRKIWLNLMLAMKAPQCLEYVLLHELLHLAERKHNARFFALLDAHMPAWRRVDALLNGRPVDARA